MESAHTPGPWAAKREGTSKTLLVHASGLPLLRMYAGRNEDNNAELIVRAVNSYHDMLSALEMALNDMEYVQRAHPEITGLAHRGKSILAARATIAKAKGE